MLKTRLSGARTNNLKNVSLELEPGQLIAITGVSGAGKSSLALDTLYAEGQRRFVESFSPYARQFLERLERPPIDALEPVPAGIAVDRRAPIKSSRSTLATMADLEPYLSALFARESIPYCPEHDEPAVSLDADRAARRVVASLPGERAILSYQVPLQTSEQYLQVREELASAGYRRLLLGGRVKDIDEVKPSEVVKAKHAEVVLDRFSVDSGSTERIAQGIEIGWQRSNGAVALSLANGEPKPAESSKTAEGSATRSRASKRSESTKAAEPPNGALVLRRGLGCPTCARPLSEPTTGLFSYESPIGACPVCRGFGRTIGLDLSKVIPDDSKALSKGAIRPWSGKSTTWERNELKKLCQRNKVPFDKPWRDLSERHKEIVLGGDGSWNKGLFPGVRGWFAWLESRTYKMHVRVLLARYRSYDVCSECAGSRLNAHALSYRLDGRNIAEWHKLEIGEILPLLEALATKTGQGEMARRELVSRLDYLQKVGLGYLTLDRQARTLSGGEAQRVTLTAALGTSLNNALFVLDEPTVGLHACDIAPLTLLLCELAARDNLVLVVEHDPAIIRAADRVIELGPSAGSAGGTVTFDGTPALACTLPTATARALLSHPLSRRVVEKPTRFLKVRSARAHNLQNVDVEIPLECVSVITGPSGSGKSTLAVGIVYRALARRFGNFDVELPEAHSGIEGAEQIRGAVLVDQSPLGRTSRGNTATYTKAWDPVRKLFAAEPASQHAGFTASHFSFNVDGGRCEACSGEGFETVEMQFLADVRLVCPICKGRRFKDAVVKVRHRGVSIADLLETTVSDAMQLFFDVPAILRALGPVARLGLGYLRLGQPLSTLSGGEAQRLKLARALGEDLKRTLFVLDEPSAGLHADEVAKVVTALDQIVAGGGSVLVVEHDLDLIRSADWVIDMGPGAGAHGGTVVATGAPKTIAKTKTRTGIALRSVEAAPRFAEPPVTKRTAEPASLRVEHAREHNLRDVSVSVPHGALTVVTGPSGSGKSSLAFDVIFAEGQRRFLETLTPYARQFLPTLPRPDVGAVSGVPPAIALEQRTARGGANSTVATVTEIAHYLRLLFAKLGTPHCPTHDLPIASMAQGAVLATLQRLPNEFSLLAPVVRARKGTYLDIFTQASRDGIVEAICDGQMALTDSPPKLARSKEHTIDLVMGKHLRAGTIDTELLGKALLWGNGTVKVRSASRAGASGVEQLFSTRAACPECGISVPELDPRWFSFNTEQGRCPSCEGSGVVERRTRKKKHDDATEWETCSSCNGTRLGPIPRAVRLFAHHYYDFTRCSARAALGLAAGLTFSGDQERIAAPVVSELIRRLQFLCDVGLDYLALDRPARTLSGGEMQRLRLAAQLGAGLTGALYILDEPTIGLHPRDTGRLLDNLRRLVDLGSTVVVVEHDVDTIRAADCLIDLGPGGGTEGGRVMAQGSPQEVLKSASSPTGRALATPAKLRNPSSTSGCEWLVLSGASEHNLKNVELRLPLERFNVIAGVSGSGKSTLVRQVLLPAVRQALGLVGEAAGAYTKLSGYEHLRRAICVDQSPIGRTPRSVPATFLGIWDQIRKLFALTSEAQVRGFGPARFSFNTSKGGGRCATCEGQGAISHEMSFLPDVVRACPACEGARFEPRTLEVRYLGLNVGEVLQLSLSEAARVFEHHPKIVAPLKTLVDLGAGYIRLGQGSHTLSGGEAQRLKLAAELTATVRHEATLYVLDEPTTGLHLADVERLISVLGRLVERGDTLAVIEHHPQVIAGADWVVELGPESGDNGGRIVSSGPPEKLARQKTATGIVLAEYFPGEVETLASTFRGRKPLLAVEQVVADKRSRRAT